MQFYKTVITSVRQFISRVPYSGLEEECSLPAAVYIAAIVPRRVYQPA